MNFKSVFPLFALLLSSLAAVAQPAQTWVNFGVLTDPPQIDAINVVNSNTMNFVLFGGVNPQLFDTSDTLNFTNVGTMTCDAGWRFDTAPAVSGLRRPAQNLFNSGLIEAGFQAIVLNLGNGIPVNIAFSLTSPKIIANADNIINTGALDVQTDGLLKLTGRNLHLARSELAIQGSGTGIFDDYWGARTNVLNPNTAFNNNFVFTPSHIITQYLGSAYGVGQTTLAFQPTATWWNATFVGTNLFVEMVLLNQPNPAISNNVYFNSFSQFTFGTNIFFTQGSEIAIEWISYATNPVTGEIITNYLNALDTYFNPPITNNFVMTNQIYPNGFVTFIPTNFSLTTGRNFFDTNGLAQPTPIPDGIFAPGTVTNEYGAYGSLVFPYTAQTNDVTGRSVSNLVARVELSASQFLDLNRTRIGNPNYVSLKATNDYAGNDAAQISSAFWDIDLASSNSRLALTNLMMPLTRFNGFVDFYRARWTNTLVIGGVTNTVFYHVLVADSQFQTLSIPQIQDFYLRDNRNTDVVLSDEFDVMRKLQINARNLTITSNSLPSDTYPQAFYPFGELNFLSGDLLWSTSFPNLVNLTNYGLITVLNGAFFGGQRTSPYISAGPGDWYQSFINDGFVSVQGGTVYANYFENGGLFDSGAGPISINAQNANIINGTLSAPASSVTINSGILLTSNAFMTVGTSLSLAVSGLLDDGSLTNCVQFVTNKNIWAVSNGFNLVTMPPFASLAATTVTNSAAAFSENFNTWAGRDLGPNPGGFVNNAAIGRLVLDGAHPDSLFTFIPANGNNALYVDDLQFVSYATNVNLNGDFIGLNIQPGMKIYFAQAEIIVGTNSYSVAKKIAEDHSNGGRLVWVSNYHCGFFSSTNLVDPVSGTTYTMNAALRNACDIDSDGDGLPNCIDDTPLGSNLPSCPCPPFSYSVSDIPRPGGGDNATSPYLEFPAPTAVVPSPVINKTFAQVKGSYYGLFAETNVSPASSGLFHVAAAGNGTFSAKLVLGTNSYAASGRFNSNGIARIRISRGRLPALTAVVQLDLSGQNLVRGSISDGNWTAQVLANRLSFDPRTAPASAFSGSYTLNIPGDSPDSGRPGGDGFASVKVDAGGKVALSGALSDGSTVAQNSALSVEGRWPFYASLYKNTGCAIGWLQASNQSVGGKLFWVKPATANPALMKSYPQGFTNHIVTAGLSYTPPLAGTPALGRQHVSFIFSGGGLASPYTNVIALDRFNRLVQSYNPSLKLTINGPSGVFSGSLSNPSSLIKLQGAIFQENDKTFGLGYFLNSGQSGQIYLGPLNEPSP